MSSLINILFYRPVFNLLIIIYEYVGNIGLAIIGVALVHKLLTFSLTKKQIKSAEKNQEMQTRMNKIKKQYKNNQEKQTKELAKVQAEYMPGMLGGCLNLIISLVLLIQVRNVVINLVNQGVHAFNEVAYSESLKYEEDYIKVILPDNFAYGEHNIEFTVATSEGKELDKQIHFGVVEKEEEVKDMQKTIREYNDSLSDEEKDKKSQNERDANIGLYIDELNKNLVAVGKPDLITAFLRPPSNQSIEYDSLIVKLDDTEVAPESIETNSGESLNLEFLGADLSRVAADFDIKDISVVWPYVLIAVVVGISQFFASKIQMGLRAKDTKKQTQKSKKKKKGQEEDTPDFSELMAESSQNMIYFFPIFTILMSLGYMGGADIIPTGVSLFWTAQNIFVIIQQLVMNREKVQEYLEKRFKFKFIREKNNDK